MELPVGQTERWIVRGGDFETDVFGQELIELLAEHIGEMLQEWLMIQQYLYSFSIAKPVLILKTSVGLFMVVKSPFLGKH